MKSLPRVVAVVSLQKWQGRKSHDLVTLRDVAFDATVAVIGHDLPGLLALRDSQHNADPIVRESHCPAFERHKGPFDVAVEDAINEFLAAHSVEGREALTPAIWGAIRAKYATESKLMTRTVLCISATPGWAATLMDKGYRVLHRSGPFGRMNFVVKKRGRSLAFTQNPHLATAIYVPNPSKVRTMLADLEGAGVLAPVA